MHHKPLAVTDETFAATVLAAEPLVVVDFWAVWCAPCRVVSAWMERLAEAYADRLLVTTVDAERNPATVAACDVRSLPTILFYRGGEVVHRQVDQIDEAGLRRLVDRLLAEAAAA